MRFDIITIFPKAFKGYFNESILKRAKEKKLIDIKIWNLRDFTTDKHHKVDDKPYGGGPGMVMKIESLANCIHKLLSGAGKSRTLFILLAASGTQFTAKIASDFARKYDRIIFICGHYEGIDERIQPVLRTIGHKLQTISVGPYILTGGELPAMIITDAISRHISGVLGKTESLEEKRYGVGVPVYTRPEIFIYKNKKYAVPKVLTSGDHKKIEEWRRKYKK